MTTRQVQILERLYTSPESPYAFRGGLALARAAKEHFDIPHAITKKWLSTQRGYTRHRRAAKVPRSRVNPTFVTGVDEQWQVDLMDMSQFKDENDGVRFLLNGIDVLSRRAFSLPLKTKKGSEVVQQLRQALQEMDGKPGALVTDKGKEFWNKDVKRWLQSHNIRHFTTQSEAKASIVERFNKTFKQSLLGWMTQANDERYVPLLPRFVQGYNARVHKAIRMAPQDVNELNQWQVTKTLYEPFLKRVNTKIKRAIERPRVSRGDLKVGDHVLVSTQRQHAFQRTYYGQWGDEVFIIDRCLLNGQFALKALNDEPIKGAFYRDELQKIDFQPDREFAVQQILKTKTVRGKKYGLVRWVGYSPDFDSWEPLDAVR